MAENKKDEILFSLLKKRGIHRASDLLHKKTVAENKTYSDLTSVVSGAKRIENEAGEIVYRKIEIPITDLSHEIEDAEYQLPGEKYFGYLEPNVIARFCGVRNPVPLEQILFVDLETTGLAGGTGTYPILAGLGYLRQDVLVLEQFFMEDFDRELASMLELNKRFDRFSVFSTYNGKSFDIPVLRTRFTLHRLRTDWDRPHIDLLHLVRKLWRGVLPECTLHSVERHLLGITRSQDVDGSMVPQIYFDYVRRRDPSAIAVVFDHNAQDVISLASILARLSYYYLNPDDDELTEMQPHLGLSQIFARHGDDERSIESLERALAFCREPRMAYFISCHIARRYKKMGRWKSALEIWESHIKGGNVHNLEPFVELAKYYEHRVRDHVHAIDVVQRALHYIDETQDLSILLGNSIQFDPQKAFDELMHRLQRLEKRLNSFTHREEEEKNED